MDQRMSGDESRTVGEETGESSGNRVGGFVLQRDNGDVEARVDEVGEEGINERTIEQRGIGEDSGQVGLIEDGSNLSEVGGSEVLHRVDTIENSSSLDAVIVINSDTSHFSNTPMEKSKKVVSEVEKSSCVIDVKSADGGKLGDSFDGERVCRICHLSSEQPPEASTSGDADTDLIHLGCGCKDELGIAHISCAEVWFKLKGNRLCEICGETVINVTGVGDNGFMEEWNEGRFVSSTGDSSNTDAGCWRGQPFCNFLMACLVIGFVLPWFFRVNMF